MNRTSHDANAYERPDERLTSALRRVIALRAKLKDDAATAERWRSVKAWQANRLRQTYADLLATPRYNAASEFFLAELYGEKDFEQRDREALRIVSKLAKLLPHRAIETLAAGVELDELSEILDERVARALVLPIDAARYAAAYRTAGTPEERAHQIEMVDRIGHALDRLARLPMLAGLLHMMRAPAERAGLGHLHNFLVNGFDSFRAMGSAKEFLETIQSRETALMQKLFAGGQ
ncbi:MAG TPA: hypothetical protein VFR86_06460 [Burkholderiaceae bacterium]|nr:hypothetical protein [Burkholderiaceae bacterium]